MPRAVRCRTSCWMSETAIRVDAGERLVEQHELRVARQRACDLEPAPLAADSEIDGALRRCAMLNSSSNSSSRCLRRLRSRSVTSRIARMLFSTESPAKDRGFLRQVADAEPRAPIHRQRGSHRARRARWCPGRQAPAR